MNSLAVPHNKVFFTSDLHCYHKNIIKYCNRPFDSVEEMNQTIIDNWNRVVPEDGITFVLGDCVFGGKEKWSKIFSQLNGIKYLIRGNHDGNFTSRDIFTAEYDFKLINVMFDDKCPEQYIFACHYPMISWPHMEKGSWMVYGHIHTVNGETSFKDKLSPSQYDVGVDNNNFTPVSFQQVKEMITKQMLYGKS